MERGVVMRENCKLGTSSRQFQETGVYSCKCCVCTGPNFLAESGQLPGLWMMSFQSNNMLYWMRFVRRTFLILKTVWKFCQQVKMFSIWFSVAALDGLDSTLASFWPSSFITWQLFSFPVLLISIRLTICDLLLQRFLRTLLIVMFNFKCDHVENIACLL